MLKEEFKSDSSRDFQARYGGTFGWYEKTPDHRILVQLVEANGECLYFQDQHNISYQAEPDKGNVFCFIPVERKLHNVGDDVWLTTRVPARQWKRGMCGQNTRIYSLLYRKSLPVIFDTVLKILKNDSNQTVNFRRDKVGIAALSPSFAVILNQVYLYDIVIGKFDEGLITLNNDLFIQEVKDVLSRNQFDLRVQIGDTR